MSGSETDEISAVITKQPRLVPSVAHLNGQPGPSEGHKRAALEEINQDNALCEKEPLEFESDGEGEEEEEEEEEQSFSVGRKLSHTFADDNTNGSLNLETHEVLVSADSVHSPLLDAGSGSESPYEEEIEEESEQQKEGLSDQHVEDSSENMHERAGIMHRGGKQSSGDKLNLKHSFVQRYNSLIQRALARYILSSCCLICQLLSFAQFVNSLRINFRNPLTSYTAFLIDVLSQPAFMAFVVGDRLIANVLSSHPYFLSFIIFVAALGYQQLLQNRSVFFVICYTFYTIENTVNQLERLQSSLTLHRSVAPFIVGSFGRHAFRTILKIIFHVKTAPLSFVPLAEQLCFALIATVARKVLGPLIGEFVIVCGSVVNSMLQLNGINVLTKVLSALSAVTTNEQF